MAASFSFIVLMFFVKVPRTCIDNKCVCLFFCSLFNDFCTVQDFVYWHYESFLRCLLFFSFFLLALFLS